MKVSKKRKKAKSMKALTKGYEKFMEGKEQVENGKELFENLLKKAVKLK